MKRFYLFIFGITILMIFIFLSQYNKSLAQNLQREEQKINVSDKMPVIYINTDDNAEIKDKKTYINAKMVIESNDIENEYLYDGKIEIKGRGNSTWDYPKKPYKIKLDKKSNILDMGENKHWVLLANYKDRSLMRSQLAVDLSEHFGLTTMQARFVILYINDAYMGVYQLFEHVRVGDTRVDIFDWEDEVDDSNDLSTISADNGYDLTGGFLLEINGYYDEVSKFTTKNNVKITVKSPEFLNTNSELFHYAIQYIQDFEDAIYSENFINSKGQHYSELFDLDDLVEYWIVNEFMGNLDSGGWSSYMYKDINGDKFHMGPVWDFDSSVGNYFDHGIKCHADQWVASRQGPWYIRLYKDINFVKKIYKKYWENREFLSSMKNKAEYYYNFLYEDAIVNHKVWNIPNSYEYDGKLVINWIEQRLKFMDEQFATVEKAYQSLNQSQHR